MEHFLVILFGGIFFLENFFTFSNFYLFGFQSHYSFVWKTFWLLKTNCCFIW